MIRRTLGLGLGYGTEPSGSEQSYSPLSSANVRLLLTPASFSAGSGWNDISGNGNNYTGTGGTASSVGSVSSVLFNGSSDFLSGPAISNFASSGQIYASAICYATGDATTPMAAGVWACVGGAGVPAQGIGYVKVGAENRFNSLFHRNADGSQWSGVDVEADCDGKWVWVESVYDGTTHRVRATDASAIIDTTSSAPASAPHSTSQLTAIGRGVELSTNLYYTGHIAAIVVFRGTPSASDMTGMRSWVSRNFGIADPGSNIL